MDTDKKTPLILTRHLTPPLSPNFVGGEGENSGSAKLLPESQTGLGAANPALREKTAGFWVDSPPRKSYSQVHGKGPMDFPG
jgi:hypothetical protein